jgi:hypothetical protein
VIQSNTRRGALIGAGLLTLAAAVPAQQGTQAIYSGQPLTQSGMKVASWGSGLAVESTEAVYSGANSLKLTTHGRFQGARLVLPAPMDVKAAVADPNAYLQIVYMISDKNASSGGGPGGMSLGSYGQSSSRPRGQQGPGRGGSGSGDLGGSGGQSGANYRMGKAQPLANFRVVMVTTDNRNIELNLPVDVARTERDQWKSLAVPVGAVRGLKESNGQIAEIRLFGDQPAVVFLGELRVLRDLTPLRLEPIQDRTIAKNDTISFTAVAEAGPTPLKYEWTVQGIANPDAQARSEVTAAYLVVGEGRTFKHRFIKSGDYKVTVTAVDVYGTKKSASQSATVQVTL